MNTLFSIIGTALFVPLALLNPTSLSANPTDVLLETTQETLPQEPSEAFDEIPSDTIFISGEIVQSLPDNSTPWLDGRVSFVGGEITSSERQYQYAEANYIPFMRTEAQYQESIRSGRFVRLSHPHLDVGARRPYVLPSTASFIYSIVDEFYSAGCGNLRVNDATRLTRVQPSNASTFSVHAAGMALDLRVSTLSEYCHNVLSTLLQSAEANGLADSTREHWKLVGGVKVPNPHFHVVVVPNITNNRIYLNAEY